MITAHGEQTGKDCIWIEMSRQNLLGEPQSEIHWLGFRGVLDVDGNTNAWGLLWRLGSGSTVFHIKSEYCNLHNSGIRPWMHYVPLEEGFLGF
jgi:hypothetical protein